MAAPEFRKGFLQLTRTTGAKVWVRVDEISVFTEGTERRKEGGEIPILTVQVRANIAYHVLLTADQLLKMMEAAAGTRMHVIDEASILRDQAPVHVPATG